jgi:hypothetical protein
MPTLVRPLKNQQQLRLSKEPTRFTTLPEKVRQRFDELRVKIADSLLTILDREIQSFERLSPNWDGADALRIMPPVIAKAKHLLRLIADRARARGIPWSPPSVAPTPDGGIDFYWDSSNRWATISILPGQDFLECVIGNAGGDPVFRVVARVEAIEAALWAMSG